MIGVARYQLMLTDARPEQLAGSIPMPGELEPCILPDGGRGDE